MSEIDRLTTAFIISLIEGMLIILGSLYTTMWGITMMGARALASPCGSNLF